MNEKVAGVGLFYKKTYSLEKVCAKCLTIFVNLSGLTVSSFPWKS